MVLPYGVNYQKPVVVAFLRKNLENVFSPALMQSGSTKSGSITIEGVRMSQLENRIDEYQLGEVHSHDTEVLLAQVRYELPEEVRHA